MKPADPPALLHEARSRTGYRRLTGSGGGRPVKNLKHVIYHEDRGALASRELTRDEYPGAIRVFEALRLTLTPSPTTIWAPSAPSKSLSWPGRKMTTLDATRTILSTPGSLLTRAYLGVSSSVLDSVVQPLELDHTYNAPYDQDGTDADRWLVLYATAEQKQSLIQGHTIPCFWNPAEVFYGWVRSISEKPDHLGRYFVVIDPEK